MVRRHLETIIPSSLANFPAVLLTGARQVGKSTLIERLHQEGLVKSIVTLDDLLALESARRDPEGFLSQFPGKVAIDEIQRAPQLLVALKKAVDQNREPGRFLLTGSANILSYPGVTESLAGRMDVMNMEGLSLAEQQGNDQKSPFLEDLFSGLKPVELAAKWNKSFEELPNLSREKIFKNIFYGGYPEVSLKREPVFRERWYSAYQTAYVERDVRDLSRLLDVVSFAQVFRMAGLQTGKLLNVKSLATDLGVDQRTVSRYLEILGLTFQTNLLRPYFKNTLKQLIKTPKNYMNDSGHACFLAGVDSPDSLSQSPSFGALLETWLWAEIRKLLSLTVGISSHFYRTHQGREVDFLLNKGQTYWGIEYKASSSISRSELSGMDDMLPILGDQSYGVFLCPSDRAYVLSSRILVAPLGIFGI